MAEKIKDLKEPVKEVVDDGLIEVTLIAPVTDAGIDYKAGDTIRVDITTLNLFTAFKVIEVRNR